MKKFPGRFVLIMSLAIALTGCGTHSADNAVDTAIADTSSPTESPNLHKQQLLIDESSFAGDELEMIKIINQITKARVNGDEKTYFSLFSSSLDSNRKMPLFEITSTGIGEINIISEDSAWVGVSVVTSENGEMNSGFTFIREEGMWRIRDID